MEFGKIIKEKRTNLNLTQSELALKLHVARQTISKWENNEGYPSLDVLIAISEVLDISTDKLLKGKDNTVVEKINSEVKNKNKYKLFSIITGFLIAITMMLIGVLSYGRYNQIELIDRYNPFLEQKIGYATLPIAKYSNKRREIFIIDNQMGDGIWQTAFFGETKDNSHWAMVEHKGSYISRLRPIAKEQFPASIKDYADTYYKRSFAEPEQHTWNPFQ